MKRQIPAWSAVHPGHQLTQGDRMFPDTIERERLGTLIGHWLEVGCCCGAQDFELTAGPLGGVDKATPISASSP